MKRLLQIPNYMYPHIGGIEQVARDIADSILDEPIEQKIICFNEDADDNGYVCRRNETKYDKVDGIDVIRCGCFSKVFSQSLSLDYPKELKKVLKEFKPDTIILHYPNPYVSSFLLKMLPKNTRFILYWHSEITKQKVLGKFFSSQSTALLKRANIVIATSPNYIEGSPFLSKFRDKCKVIPNCIRPERLKITPKIEEKTKKLREKYGDKTICFAVGRHVPYKGMTYLVEASKYLDNNFAILIGGKGELTESLKKQAKDDSKVEFLGRVSDVDLIAYYSVCDIFCFPSITKNEAFGIALAEGMYIGKPAVTFTIPGSGVNYVSLDGITGIECPNSDAKAFAEALKKLGNNPILCNEYAQNAKQRVIDNFMYEQFGIAVKEIL